MLPPHVKSNTCVARSAHTPCYLWWTTRTSHFIRNTNSCPCSRTGTNTLGGFRCSCNNTGRELVGGPSGTTCVEINECTRGTHNCNALATCSDVPGSFTCACNRGYTGSGTACTDINECVVASNNCDTHATCSNTVGSFTCACTAGWVDDDNIHGIACTNVDECALASLNICRGNATCTDSPGTYSCSCNDGYGQTAAEAARTDVYQCTNLTGCASNPCLHGGSCSSAGSIGYTCTCDGTGYRGTRCETNYDECAIGRGVANGNDCNAVATCSDTVGSFTCACNAGYSGNGLTCSNVNECTLGSNNCNSNAACSDSVGSFTCACNEGYSGNGVTCANIDECALGSDDCNSNAACSDTIGSFSCACNAGWSGTGLSCSNVNECNTGADDCHALADCTDTVGSFTCACNSSRYSGDGITCALRTLGYGIELSSQRTGYVGQPISFRIVARDADGNLLPTETSDVIVTVNTSRV